MDYDEIALHQIRVFTKIQLLRILVDLSSPILEIGPSVSSGALNSPIFETNPSYFVDMKHETKIRDLSYLTLDIDPGVGADFLGSIESNQTLLPDNYFRSVIAFHILEHCMNPFNAVKNIRGCMQTGGKVFFITPWDLRFHGPRPDAWRISDDGYKSLLANHFQIDEFIFEENPVRSLSPYAIFCEATAI